MALLSKKITRTPRIYFTQPIDSVEIFFSTLWHGSCMKTDN
ncbi:hypothetical protein SAMN05216316_0918 [Nitrosovibrio sp. Nv6]|nr:hypothetical protein SAMN05216316_0918 [Nitrosovibrio sp. Nv6]